MAQLVRHAACKSDATDVERGGLCEQSRDRVACAAAPGRRHSAIFVDAVARTSQLDVGQGAVAQGRVQMQVILERVARR